MLKTTIVAVAAAGLGIALAWVQNAPQGALPEATSAHSTELVPQAPARPAAPEPAPALAPVAVVTQPDTPPAPTPAKASPAEPSPPAASLKALLAAGDERVLQRFNAEAVSADDEALLAELEAALLAAFEES
ncbi:MAG: hypothetical protein AAGI15_17380 [Pseudomonadota bacterium]